MKSKAEALDLLQSHFPEASPHLIDWYADFCATGFPGSGVGISAVEPQVEIKHLENIQRLIRQLCSEHWELRTSVHGYNTQRLLWELHWELTG